MYVVRDIMYCKPGKVRPMVEKFVAMSKMSGKMGMPAMRIMTDFCAEQYWTVVSEMEVPDLAAFEKMMSETQGGSADEYEEDGGAHEGVPRPGRPREAGEIYKIEGV